MRRNIGLSLLGAALLLAGCDSVGDRHVLAVDGTGTVEGIAVVDRDGSLDSSGPLDTPLANARISVVFPGTERAVASATTTAAGLYRITSVPVGRYEIRVDPAILGDTLRVAKVDSAAFTVSVRDTARVAITLGFPLETAAGARRLAAGRPVRLEGLALNAPGTFADGSVHLADSTGVVRVLNTAQLVFAEGDTVRVVGRTGTRDGQPVVTAAIVRRLRAGTSATPREVSTSVAAEAEGGALDAGLVRIAGTTIIEAQGVAGGIQLTVNDGSGPLQVFLDSRAAITSPTPIATGAAFAATGLLVPRENEPGRWRLRPRSSADVAVTVPRVSVEEARRLPVGRRVTLEGVALHAWATFGDGSLHIADPTGSIRALQVPSAFIFPGDNVRLVGVTGVRDGQTVLTQVTTSVLGRADVPPPSSATTETASRANGGAWDAALVRVQNAAIVDTASIGFDFRLTINDDSGPLMVYIANNTGIGRTGLVPGARVDATGVLVALVGGTTWRLQPRAREDLVVVPVP
jgi:hypothetical protein